MMDDKPKGGLIIALGGPKMKGADEDEGDDMSPEEMKKSAMADFISAVHAKDPAGALAAYSDLCELHDEPDMDDEEKPGKAMGY